MKASNTNKNVAPDLFYIIGINNNWKFSRKTLTVLVFFLISLFLGLIGTVLYQYLYYHSIFVKVQQRYDAQKLQTNNLQDNLEKLERQYLVLKQEIDKKDFIISMTQELSVENTEENSLSKKNEKKALQEISNLQNTLDARETEIRNLENQNKKSAQKIQAMLQRIADLKQKIRDETENVASASLQPDLVIEQFTAAHESNLVSIQFNLKSLGNRSQAGYIMILPVREEEQDQKIELDIENAESFSIKRFRTISKEFSQSADQPMMALRIAVWSRDKKKLLDQIFSLK